MNQGEKLCPTRLERLRHPTADFWDSNGEQKAVAGCGLIAVRVGNDAEVAVMAIELAVVGGKETGES